MVGGGGGGGGGAGAGGSAMHAAELYVSVFPRNSLSSLDNLPMCLPASSCDQQLTAVIDCHFHAVTTPQQAEVREVLDAAPINEWAARVTHGLVKTIVPPNAQFDLVLTNALYFKGASFTSA